jgi:IS5 family transposase
MLIVGYCYGIRFERRLCEEVELHMAYRWFCRLDLDDKVPDHSTFSVNRHGRFRDSDLLRQVFEAVVRACMDAGLIKGEGFAIDASVIEADASRYHGKPPGDIDWSLPERQTRAAAEFLGGLERLSNIVVASQSCKQYRYLPMGAARKKPNPQTVNQRLRQAHRRLYQRYRPLTDIVGVTLFRVPDPKSATHQCVVGRGLLQGD